MKGWIHLTKIVVYLHLDKKKYYICRIKLKNRAKLLLEFREKSAFERKGNDQPFFTISPQFLWFPNIRKKNSLPACLSSSSHLFVIDACVVQISGQAAQKNQQKTKRNNFLPFTTPF